ncbi:sugar ABC transporter substrate-binding protein [Mitsuokella jalaludinii]|uniref:sugar ABC transporter substrate-binding protein n=1 Tax=Mitsuokella jalaludinii TaxID=187979 RepID=UPI00298D236D|nr:substrate-binding domain-containing protein [Mitsuokella jalaludinii]
MRTMAVVFLALLVGTAVILLPLQDAQEEMSRPAYTVGVVLKAMDSEHWLAVRSSMQKAAEENHIRLIVMTPENEAAYGEQDQIIEDLLQEGIDALIVSPVNIHHTAQWVEEAQQRGIPLLTIDEKLPGIPYVGSDNYRIGQMAAEEMASRLPAGASVGIIAGSANQDAHIKRTAGFRDYLRDHTDLRLAAVAAEDTKYRQAARESADMLKQHPDIRGFFVTSAVMTLGVIDTTEPDQPRIHIIGVDTQNDALAALRLGRIDAMISQDGHESGKMAIDLIVKELQGEGIDGDHFISNEVITKGDADAYQMKED